MEIWKDVEGFEGRYMVSNHGNVKSLRYYGHNREHNLKLTQHHTGYLMVQLNKHPSQSFLVHILVAKAFIPQTEGKTCVNHKDGNKTNNKVENLEWVTYAENTQHAIRTGLVNPHNASKRIGKDHYSSKAVLQYDSDGIFIRKWDCQSDAARYYSAKPSTLSNCIDKPTKLFHGFMWVSYAGDIQQSISPSMSRFRPVKVTQRGMDGSFIKEWPDATFAAETLGLTAKGIKDCCRGRQKTHGGYIWEF
jgi:hypothetical protein